MRNVVNVKKIINVVICFFTIFFLTGNVQAQTEEKLRLGHVMPGELDYKGFSLSEDGIIKISGTGALYDKWGNDLFFYGWILESKSRKVIWSMLDEFEDEYYDNRDIFTFEDEIQLRKGDYEVYYTAMFDYSSNYYKSETVGSVIRNIFRAIRSESNDYNYKYNKLSMTIAGDEDLFIINAGDTYLKNIKDKSIVSFLRTENNELLKESFSLKEKTRVTIYSIGERIRGKDYDHAWIYDLKTHEKVWPNDDTKYAVAGGAKKNIFSVQKIDLPKGDYQVNYVSDDSHSFYKWNAMPPNDPQFWGITIWTDKEGKKNITEVSNKYEPVVDLTRIGDDEYMTQGFEIKRSMDIRVMCLGEILNDQLCDYGWISNVKKHTPIWEFTEKRSEDAGGNSKNRMINEIIYLEKGKYIAYYASDDSHSFRDWNANPPYDQNLWGISLWTLKDEDRKYISLFDEREYQDENVIAEIIRVRDNEYMSRGFELEKDAKIKIYAIGEGTEYGMDDAGWIKSMERGKIVWEMTYRNTEHAGGAKKNRLFNDYIILPAGSYKVYYESDGSHSYHDWNASPPHNLERYGITIYNE